MFTITVCLSVVILIATADASPVDQLKDESLSDIQKIKEIQDTEKPQQRKTRNHENYELSDSPIKENMTEKDKMIGHDEDYVFYQNANGSFKLHSTPSNWAVARLVCYDEGAELASPENDALLATMSQLLLTSSQPPLHIFTGINDLYSKGFFTSIKGIPISCMPAHWAPDEPDNVNHGNNCLVMQRNGLLLDSKCDDVYPYICYKRQQKGQINLCGTTDTEYIFNKHTKSCHKLHTEFVPWQTAYATCAREGGYLAILNSEYEAQTLARMIKSEWIWAHVGFSYWRKGLWVTIHGETLAQAGYDSWAPGEPNDWNEERCGSLAADGHALVDIDCVDHARPFICEKSSSM
ncbi:uncharacterized protein LOC125239820 isoform X1 [Leguminivora glycinivorella]|uniref:uncharacterized protein LOC125239820 isoform X1 n=1 Tax=Leguminivora glycinivorella TaxID=1035111 RepID=UPI0020108422|nr:uncharacterized protein LOC125239820 isoform X1 [Leguminivora glycinivorella]